jgi:hypothetical protein
MKIYYMRDNHTFVPLPLNIDEALNILCNEFDKGYTFGTMFSKDPEMESVIHASGSDKSIEFFIAAKEWLQQAIDKATANG